MQHVWDLTQTFEAPLIGLFFQTLTKFRPFNPENDLQGPWWVWETRPITGQLSVRARRLGWPLVTVQTNRDGRLCHIFVRFASAKLAIQWPCDDVDVWMGPAHPVISPMWHRPSNCINYYRLRFSRIPDLTLRDFPISPASAARTDKRTKTAVCDATCSIDVVMMRLRQGCGCCSRTGWTQWWNTSTPSWPTRRSSHSTMRPLTAPAYCLARRKASSRGLPSTICSESSATTDVSQQS